MRGALRNLHAGGLDDAAMALRLAGQAIVLRGTRLAFHEHVELGQLRARVHILHDLLLKQQTNIKNEEYFFHNCGKEVPNCGKSIHNCGK